MIEPLALLVERIDFARTPLGPRASWPQSLRTAFSICQSSRFPMLIWWGPELCMLYNDAYVPILGTKHPASLGQAGERVWSEIWHVIGPMLRGVMERGEATWSEDQLLEMFRNGFTEETYFTWSYSPITDETGGVGGVFTAVTETTARVLAERRLHTLRQLGEQVATAHQTASTCAAAVATLGRAPRDVPFALLYLLDADGRGARLAGCTGLAPGTAASLPHVAFDEVTGRGWPIADAAASRERVIVDDLTARFGALVGDPWPEPIERAVVLPLATSEAQQPFGVLVAGVSPRLALDAPYRDFLGLAADQITSALASARAYEDARSRAEALAELDRAKTTFFSNVSHEFRTPLTLMLGPLEDALASGALSGAALEIAHRNALRLLKLVNALLDFSRIEAGRAEASYEPTDLAGLTRELAAAFEPAFAAAGLTFDVEVEALDEPVYVDAAMWDKIVLNLLSNAFKFTFEGGVRVTLSRAAAGDAVELVVADTGIGVSEEELPRLFERFHRVEGARSRTHEGSGIGLALVHELVRLHAGSVVVTSAPGAGSTFRVQVPLGFAHLPHERIRARGTVPATAQPASAYVDEARRWLPDAPPPVQVQARASRSARILVADDNADMRDYVRRILGAHWSVERVPDGQAALDAARAHPPDLIVSDIMMPGLDGFELLAALRADPTTQAIPVIFLSARAGDEARAIGLEAGAEDYLVKPFAARELVARVSTQLELATLRTDAATIQRITNELGGELEMTKLLQLITDEATRVTGAELGALFYNVTSAQGEPCTLYTLSGVPHEVFARFHVPRNTTLFRETFEHRQIVRSDDITTDPRYGVHAPHHGVPDGHPPVISYLAAPVVARSGEVLGALFLAHSQPARFGERSERLLSGIAAQGAVAIDNARLYDRVRDLLERERVARLAAEEANRAKDEFLAVLGHELRNPLAPIQTALQLMELRGDQRTRERLVLERQVGHLVRLVDDLLDVSRITRGKIELDRERLELAAVIAEAIEMASPLIEQKRHRLIVAVPRSGLLVDVDRGRMAQVVSNLLTNAAKYTPAGGEITVAARADGAEILLEVRDNGIGIAEESLSRVFEPFVQDQQALDRARGGLGLGLTIVRNFVQLHGGIVTAASRGAGAGSVFTVRLPAAPSRSAADEDTDVTQPVLVPRLDARRVLVVDDNVDAADLVVATLAALGHHAEAAHDGPSALGVASRLRPHVALLDIGLPVMDGYELARRMRELPELHSVRLVALTGYGSETDRARSLEAGFDEHLVKPLALERLEEVLEMRPG